MGKKAMIIYNSFQNARDYKDSGREGAFVRALVNFPAQHFQSAAIAIYAEMPSVQKHHTFTAWTCSCHLCESAQIRHVHKQQHPQFSRTTRMRHTWAHNLEKGGDVLINMPHKYSTEGAIQLILRGESSQRLPGGVQPLWIKAFPLSP